MINHNLQFKIKVYSVERLQYFNARIFFSETVVLSCLITAAAKEELYLSNNYQIGHPYTASKAQ